MILRYALAFNRKAIMKKCKLYVFLLCILLAQCVITYAGTPLENDDIFLKSKKLSAFKEYVVERTLFQQLGLKRPDYGAFKNDIFVYTDTLAHTLPCKLMVTLSKRGGLSPIGRTDKKDCVELFRSDCGKRSIGCPS